MSCYPLHKARRIHDDTNLLRAITTATDLTDPHLHPNKIPCYLHERQAQGTDLPVVAVMEGQAEIGCGVMREEGRGVKRPREEDDEEMVVACGGKEAVEVARCTVGSLKEPLFRELMEYLA